MADFNNLREQAKQWLSSMFVPKELSPEGIANTGAGAASMALGAATQPGVVPAMYMLDKLLKTNAGKQIQTMLDATGPMGGGLDDIVVAGAKTAPAALGMVAPLISNLGRMKPRGVPAKPSEWFHSNLAEAVDKAWLAEGKPSDLLSIKQVKAWLNKLPGMGVKKEEIKHFDLANALSELEKGKSETSRDFGDDDILLGLIENFDKPIKQLKAKVTPGITKISKQELAHIIDRKIPVLDIDNGALFDEPSNKYSQYTLPNGSNYRNHIFQPDGLSPEDPSWTGEGGSDYIKNPMLDIHQSASGHWDNPTVLQHIRTTDRVLPDGRKALYAEEVQSDWQQQHPETYPLVQNYEDLAHKYLYRKAADEGYDSVAWAPASVHIQRWGGSKEKPRPVSKIFDLDYLSDKNEPGNLWQQYSTEIDKLEQDNPLIVPTNYYGEPSSDWLELIRPIQQKYIQLANEQGIMVPGKDERFSGFESFYNKRMVDSATGMLKRMGGGKVSETNLTPTVPDKPSPNPRGWADPGVINNNPKMEWKDIPQEPIETILNKYRAEFNPDAGYVQPSPNKSFVYDIKPEDKNITPQYKSLQDQLKDEKDPAKRTELRRILMTQGDTNPPEIDPWSAPMAGKTVPLWMLLSGMAFDQLRGDKK